MNLKKYKKFAWKLTLGATAIACFLSGELKNKTESKIPILFPVLDELQFPVKREDIIMPISEIIPLYTDCDQKTYNNRILEYAKTPEERIRGVEKRRNLEKLLTRYFKEQTNIAFLKMRYINLDSQFSDPLGGRGWFNNSFNYLRLRGINWIEEHEAIDIFVKIDSPIYAPVSSVVIASADDWNGSWKRGKGLEYLKGGLGKLSGNGILLFNPSDTSYYFMLHMNEVYAMAGDIVSRGDLIGTVGRTGNAISPYSKTHLHIAYKKPGIECGIEGVLVAQNLFPTLSYARDFLYSQKKNERIVEDNQF